MVKSIIKEIVIMLLLVIAILLVLAILFYNYRPSINKIPATVEAYVLPDEMQVELEETIQETTTQNIIKTYRVDSNDLKGYEKTNDYGKGKVNPFEAISSLDDTDEENDENIENDDEKETPSGNGFFNEVK